MTLGLTTLIPKAKPRLIIYYNWCLIYLLNDDYKIFALILPKRLKKVLDLIIEETQSGFMLGRHIMNNIRLVLAILNYQEMSEDDGFILFLDFYKACDTVEHQFLLQLLKEICIW